MKFQTKCYFFCGIGGSGMSALALILNEQGHDICGSDRSRDKGETPEKFKLLEDAGIKLFPQDGSGISQGVDFVVVSSAVESSVPDAARALELGIPIQKRAQVLASLVNAARGICIGGTSGKTTVTGMVAHMLYQLGFAPGVMNGGQIINFLDKGLPGNAMLGGGNLFVSETDESDGSIALFTPAIAVVNNITLDHKPLEELRPLFRGFVQKAREAVIVNLDDPEAAQLVNINPHTITFSFDNPAADITAQKIDLRLQVPGRHNIMNALAALGVAKALGISQHDALPALAGFKGTKRRFEIVGRTNGITVIDDFAHNPDKIAATLQTLRTESGRIIAIFQPHGYRPTKMMKDGLVACFENYLGADDLLLMPEIYYAGGTADKSISSRDITDAVAAAGRKTHFFMTRAEIVTFLRQNARPGDRIVSMGARDDTLPEFAADILRNLEKEAA